ncbi:MAG: hypothetical protein ACK54C_01965 [Betaproteobacteria bacterium]
MNTLTTALNETCDECGKPLQTALAKDQGFCDRSCQHRYLRMLSHRAKEAHKKAVAVAARAVRRG